MKDFNKIKSMARSFLLVAFVLATSGGFAQSPGGVSTDLQLWFRANNSTSTTTNGDPVDTWTAYVGGVTATSGTDKPVYQANAINFNPAVNFADNEMELSNLSGLPSGNSPRTLIAVVTNSNTVGLSFILGYSSNTYLTDQFNLLGVSGTAPYFDPGYRYYTSTGLTADTNPSLVSFAYDASANRYGYLYTNGVMASNSPYNTTFLADFNTGTDVGYLGNHAQMATYNYPWNGNIAEVIAYSSDLHGTDDMKKVETYLAVKYGLTKAGDYMAANGDVIWDATANSAYHNRITAIGVEATSHFVQPKSLSEHGGILTIEGNSSNFTNGSYLVVGDNNATLDYGNAAGSYDHINRIWKVALTGTTGAVTLDIGSNISGAQYLLVSSSTNFSAATKYDLSSGQASVTLNDGEFFTFAKDGAAPPSGVPGGVASNLAMWFKAASGTNTTTNGAVITSWTDESGNGISAAQADANHQPVYKTNALNYNPAVRFTPDTDGAIGGYTSDFMKISDISALPQGNSPVSIIAVANNNGETTVERRFVFGYGTEASYSDGVALGVLRNKAVFEGGYINALVRHGYLDSDVPWTSGAKLLSGTYSSSTTHLYGNGSADANSPYTTTSAWDIAGNYLANAKVGYLGATYWEWDNAAGLPVRNLEGWDGDIAEVIVYASDLNGTAELNKIESYLAIKYGITKAGDYTLSDGTVVWTADATYQNRITVIGQDDGSALDQPKSTSGEANALVTLDNSGSTGNGNFLSVGDNGGATTYTSSGAPSGKMIMDRVWKVQETGTLGAVTLSVNEENAVYLLVSNSTDFSGATPQALSGGSISIDLNNGEYFTLARDASLAPGGVIENLTAWFRADAGTNTTTDGDAVSLWTGQSPNSMKAEQSVTENQPSFKANALNFNPAVYFNADYDGLGSTNNNTSDFLKYADISLFPQGNEPMSIIAVAKAENGWAYRYLTGWGSEAAKWNGVSLGIEADYAMFEGGYMAPLYKENGNQWYSGTRMLSAVYNAQKGYFYENGNAHAEHDFLYEWNVAGANELIYPKKGYLGASYWAYEQGVVADAGYAWRNLEAWNGDIAEVIVYSSALNGSTELNKVESYLAIKYGITKPGDYITSDATVVWEGDATYQNRITVIGQDNASGLDQPKSVSTENGGLVTIDNAGSTGNGNYLAIADNGAATDYTTTGAPTNYAIMNRVWKVQETGTLGNIDLTTSAANAQYILVSSSEDFSGATPQALTDGSISIDFTSGQYFTFASDAALSAAIAPGGVANGLVMWNKADEGVTDNSGTVTDWADQTGTNTFTVNGDPQTGVSELNYNNLIDFDGTDDFFVGSANIDFTEAFWVGKFNDVGGRPIAGDGDTGGNCGSYFFMNDGGSYYLGDEVPNYLSASSGGSSFALLNGAMNATESHIRINGYQTNNTGVSLSGFNRTPLIGVCGTREDASEFNGSMGDAIVYDRVLSAQERTQVESYLAAKYGLTKKGNYVAANGFIYWDATENAAYHNRVTVIGHDTKSALNQQVKSISSENDAFVEILHNYPSNGYEFLPAAINYCAIGDNDGSKTVDVVMSDKLVMERTWKMVEESGIGANIQLRIPNTVDAQYVIYKTADADFSTGATYVNLTADGSDLIAEVPSVTMYFTFGKDNPSPEYTASFTVVDEYSNGLNDAEISINSGTYTTDLNGEVSIDLPDGSYPFTVSKPGHETSTGTLIISGGAVQQVVTLNTQYTSTVAVFSGSTAISGATVDLDGNNLTTNADGEAVTALINGNYPYSVTATGYENGGGLLTVSGTEAYQMINLTATGATKYTALFTVNGNGTPLSGATISINGTELTTNGSGQASVDLPDGQYPYIATANSFTTGQGVVEISGGTISHTIDLSTATEYPATFTVTDGGNVINGATVSIDGYPDATTSGNGQAAVNLPDDIYDFTVTAGGYLTGTGTITVSGGAIDRMVMLSPDNTTAPLEAPGNALQLDGVDDYVELENLTPALDWTSSMTWEAWFKTSNIPGTWANIIGSEPVNSTLPRMRLMVGNGSIFADYFASETDNVVLNTPISLTDNRWHHVALVNNMTSTTEGTLSLYVDGNEVASSPYSFSTSFATSQPTYIGKTDYVDKYMYEGMIDEVRVWQSARSLQELRDNMYIEVPNPDGEADLVAYYGFDENSGTSAPDQKGNYNGILHNMNGDEWGASYALVVPEPTAATTVDFTSFTANWNVPVTGTLDGYYLDVATDADFTNMVVDGEDVTGATNFEVTSLTQNTQYFYRVNSYLSALGDVGAWHYSTPISVTTNGEAVYVDGSNGSDATGDGSETSPYQTIGKGVTESSPNGNIYVAPGTYPENVTTDKPITIIGEGAGITIIDGGGNGSVVSNAPATDPDIKLVDLTLTGGSTTGNGGGVSNTGTGTLTIEDCEIGNNSTTGTGVGGGVYTAGPLVINRCGIVGNSTENGGSGVHVDGGGDASITSSTIGENTGGAGGLSFNTTGTVNMLNCTVNENDPVGVVVNDGTIDLTNNIISNSTSGTDFTLNGGSVGMNLQNICENTSAFTPAYTSDPNLDGAQISDGLTYYRPLVPTDAFENAHPSAPATDQLGMTRLNNPEIGAVEYYPDYSTPPTITSTDVSAPENQTTVTPFVATDPDNGDELTYSITGGDDQTQFTIDDQTGELEFNTAPDYETPTDDNTDGVYLVEVTVTDKDDNTDTETINVTVTNVSEPPAITSDTDVSSPENQTAVTTITATDPDTDDEITYSISGGADGNLFEIDPNTGELTFIAAPDFETPTDDNTNGVYVVEVTATDQADNTDPETFNVTVTNVSEFSDNPPAITSDTDVSSPENQTAVTTITATDPDTDDEITYSISGGADGSLFEIDPNTGELTFITAPDFETPTDDNTDGVYVVEVTATDQADNTDTETINVTITNVSEFSDNPPAITSDTDVSSPENQTAVTTITATDPDTDDEITYSISGGADGNLFEIDPNTGELTFITAPDFENPTDANGDGVYVVEITATDMADNTDTEIINVTVSDTPEPPAITSNTEVSSPENQTAVTTITATDPDTDDEITFSITGGSDMALFDIDPTTGALSFKTAPDFESPTDANDDGVYVVEVTATDQADNTDTETINVTITNVSEFSDNPPAITSDTDVSSPENQTAVTTITATDPDTDDEITFSITGGSDMALFEIDPVTGLLSFITVPDYEKFNDLDANGVYEVEVTATDKAGNTAAEIITITLTNVLESVEAIEANNLMTPNGDGKNDYFIVNNVHELVEYDFFVFNNIGEIIYQTKTYDNTWDATYQGKQLPSGTYYYMFRNGNTTLKGTITIIKEK